jgi:hypothetical protein
MAKDTVGDLVPRNLEISTKGHGLYPICWMIIVLGLMANRMVGEGIIHYFITDQ